MQLAERHWIDDNQRKTSLEDCFMLRPTRNKPQSWAAANSFLLIAGSVFIHLSSAADGKVYRSVSRICRSIKFTEFDCGLCSDQQFMRKPNWFDDYARVKWIFIVDLMDCGSDCQCQWFDWQSSVSWKLNQKAFSRSRDLKLIWANDKTNIRIVFDIQNVIARHDIKLFWYALSSFRIAAWSLW